jgi:hypothetical protein
MERTTISAAILVVFLSVAGCTSQRYAQYHREHPPVTDTLAMMKTQDVISLTKAGVSDSLIITMLATSHSWFQLKTQDVLDLKNAGVSERVINAMIESNEPLTAGDRYMQDGYYDYPPYYWYPGYYPYSYYPYWYYPSFYFGYSYYRSGYISRPTYFGSYGYRGGWGGGMRRR